MRGGELRCGVQVAECMRAGLGAIASREQFIDHNVWLGEGLRHEDLRCRLYLWYRCRQDALLGSRVGRTSGTTVRCAVCNVL